MRSTLPTIAACIGALALLYACKNDVPSHSRMPAFHEEGVNLVVEYPAGTFVSEQAALPVPGSLGYIPSTLDEDGNLLQCIFLGASGKKNSAHKALPVAAVQWRIDGKTTTCIVCVPTAPEQRSCPVEDFIAMRLKYDYVRLSLELWFRHNYMPPQAQWLGWQNEVYAEAEVYRSARRFAERD